MFESAELGHQIDKRMYAKEEPILREALPTLRRQSFAAGQEFSTTAQAPDRAATAICLRSRAGQVW